jgi:hypothetical protein
MFSPTSLKDLLGQETLKKTDISKNHLLFHGPAGTGKSTAAKLIVKGGEVLYMNASTERKIGDVRNTILSFVRIPPILKPKFVVMDECDNLTSNAQDALKRIVEGSETRFIFICNYVTAIIPPILSRCVCIPFIAVPEKECVEFLRTSTTLDQETCIIVSKICKGDVRRLKKIALHPEIEITLYRDIENALRRFDPACCKSVGDSAITFATHLFNEAIPLLPVLSLAECDDEVADYERITLMYEMAQQSDKPTCGSSHEQNRILFARGIELWFMSSL